MNQDKVEDPSLIQNIEDLNEALVDQIAFDPSINEETGQKKFMIVRRDKADADEVETSGVGKGKKK